jgi:hypothetical protein
MKEAPAVQPAPFGHLTAEEKRDHPTGLSDVVADIEPALTRAQDLPRGPL